MTDAILSTLQRLQAQYEPLAVKAEALRAQRNAAIFDALKAGCTHTQIAGATGLTRGRIGQIAQRTES